MSKADPKQADSQEQTEKRLDLRARARAGVAECLRRMTMQVWRTGKSHQEVADMFGVQYDTVTGWASTASQIILHSIGNGEDVRARLLAGLERINEMALDCDEPDLRAAVAAISEQAKLLSLITTNVRVLEPEVDIGKLKPEELVAYLELRLKAAGTEEHRAQLSEHLQLARDLLPKRLTSDM